MAIWTPISVGLPATGSVMVHLKDINGCSSISPYRVDDLRSRTRYTRRHWAPVPPGWHHREPFTDDTPWRPCRELKANEVDPNEWVLVYARTRVTEYTTVLPLAYVAKKVSQSHIFYLPLPPGYSHKEC